MALDTTVGGADSDSYATIDQADTYAEKHGVDAWLLSSVDETSKEQALRRACQALDGGYRKRFPGSRVNGREQALEWPRDNAYDCGGCEIDATAIPEEIKRAQIEFAFRELAKPGSLAPDVILSQAKVLTQVGPVQWTPLSKSASAGTLAPTITKVNELLGCILRPAGSFLTRA